MSPFSAVLALAAALESSARAPRLTRREALAAAAAPLSAAAAPLSAAAAPLASATSRVRRVLVAGASGRTGLEVMRALADDPRYAPIPLVRSAARWRASRGDGAAAPVEVDLAAPPAAVVAALAPTLRRCDDVICAVGFRPTFASDAADRAAALAVDRDGVAHLVDACERAALAGRFVLVSSLLTGEAARARANLSYRLLNGLGGVVDAKAGAEARVRRSALDWTILRPGVFVEAEQGRVAVGGEDRFVGEPDDARGLARVACKSPFFAASGAACAVTRAQLAAACVAALADDGASRRALEVVARPDAPPLRGALTAGVVL